MKYIGILGGYRWEQWWDLGLMGPVGVEIHEHHCQCSYCDPWDDQYQGRLRGIKPMHWGLNGPHHQSKNSWWAFKIGRLYIRWTGFWLQAER